MKISDDNVKEHRFKINNVYLVPKVGVRLLIPKHWEKEYKKRTGRGEQEIKDDENIKICWEYGKYTRTTKLTNGRNIGNITTYEGYNKHNTLMKALSIK